MIWIRIAAVLALVSFGALTVPLAGAPSSDRTSKDRAVPADTSSNGAPDPMLGRILQAFDKAQRETSSLVAGFTEKKQLKLLARPVLSRGEFYYHRPNQVRWEYLEPDRKVFVITEDMYLAYYPALKRAEEVPIKKFVGKRLFRFLGLGQSIDELGKYYEFRLAPQNRQRVFPATGKQPLMSLHFFKRLDCLPAARLRFF